MWGLAVGFFLLFAQSCEDSATQSIPLRIVPDDYETIQAAIDAADPGDIVLLRPGIYTHMETHYPDDPEFPNGIRTAMFLKEGVVVAGDGGPGEVVVRDTTGADTTYGAAIHFMPDNRTNIQNVDFEDFHIGVVIRGDKGGVYGCRVAGSDAGIWAFRATEPEIIGNLVEDCIFDGVLNQLADATIAINFIRDCGGGVGIEVGGSPFVTRNLICLNSVGVVANTGVTPIIQRNVIIRNQQYGLFFSSGAVPIAVDNDIYENPIGIRADFYNPPLEEPINAVSNFWDTLDIDSVGLDLILDENDTPSAGAEVEYLPIGPSPFNPFNFDPTAQCEVEDTETLRKRLVSLAAEGPIERPSRTQRP